MVLSCYLAISDMKICLVVSSSLSQSAALSIDNISCPQWVSLNMHSMHTSCLSTTQKASSFLKCLLQVCYSSSANEKSLDSDLLFCYWIYKRAQFWGKSSTEEIKLYSAWQRKHFFSLPNIYSTQEVQNECPQCIRIRGICLGESE